MVFLLESLFAKSINHTGMKFKLAHKRADKNTWSTSEKAQRKKLIKIFQGMIDQMEQELEV